jgi:hypothetical protein
MYMPWLWAPSQDVLGRLDTENDTGFLRVALILSYRAVRFPLIRESSCVVRWGGQQPLRCPVGQLCLSQPSLP